MESKVGSDYPPCFFHCILVNLRTTRTLQNKNVAKITEERRKTPPKNYCSELSDFTLSHYIKANVTDNTRIHTHAHTYNGYLCTR